MAKKKKAAKDRRKATKPPKKASKDVAKDPAPEMGKAWEGKETELTNAGPEAACEACSWVIEDIEMIQLAVSADRNVVFYRDYGNRRILRLGTDLRRLHCLLYESPEEKVWQKLCMANEHPVSLAGHRGEHWSGLVLKIGRALYSQIAIIAQRSPDSAQYEIGISHDLNALEDSRKWWLFRDAMHEWEHVDTQLLIFEVLKECQRSTLKPPPRLERYDLEERVAPQSIFLGKDEPIPEEFSHRMLKGLGEHIAFSFTGQARKRDLAKLDGNPLVKLQEGKGPQETIAWISDKMSIKAYDKIAGRYQEYAGSKEKLSGKSPP